MGWRRSPAPQRAAAAIDRVAEAFAAKAEPARRTSWADERGRTVGPVPGAADAVVVLARRIGRDTPW